MAILITNKVNFKLKLISKNKKHIMIKGSLHQKEITIINVHAREKISNIQYMNKT